MLEVKFYDTVDDKLLKFAVIISQNKGKWVFCKHKEMISLLSGYGSKCRIEDSLGKADFCGFRTVKYMEDYIYAD